MRILIAGILGAIAMFAWTSIAHVATPLASMGISKMPHEAAVTDAMKTGIGARPGLYFFPWVDPADPKMMEKSAALMKTSPAGFVIYQPAGAGMHMGPMLAKEFFKELAQSLIAALLLSLAALGCYWKRVGFVTLIGGFAVLGTDVSYWIWYGFPLSYTLGAMTIEFVGVVAAGLVIAAFVGKETKAA
jgi:hypothetical protein